MDPFERSRVLLGAEQAVPSLDLVCGQHPFGGESFAGQCPLVGGEIWRRGRADEQTGATPEVVGGIEKPAEVADLNGGELEGIDEFGPKQGADALGLKFELVETSRGRFAVPFAQVVENGFGAAIEDWVDLRISLAAGPQPFFVDVPEDGFEWVEVRSLDPEFPLGFRGVDQREEGSGNAMVLSWEWPTFQRFVGAEGKRGEEDKSGENVDPVSDGSGPPRRTGGAGEWHGALLDPEARQLVTVRPG